MTRFIAILGLLLTVFAALPGAAQIALPTSGGDTATAIEDPLTPEAVREMVSRLSDAEVRDMLLSRLDAVAAEVAAETADEKRGLLDFARQAVVGPLESVVDALRRAPLIWSDQAKSFSVFVERLGWDGVAFLFIVLALAVFAGLAVELVFRRVVRNWVERDSGAGERSLRQTLLFLGKRFATDILAVIVFYQAANFIGPLIGWNLSPLFGIEEGRGQFVGAYIAGIWWWLIVIPRLGGAVTRFVMAPSRPEHRLVHADDETARLMVRRMVLFSLLFGFTIWIVRVNEFNGVAAGDSRLGFWLNIAVLAFLGWWIWTQRTGIATMMLGDDPDATALDERAARVYPMLLFSLVFIMWWVVEILASYQMWDVITGWPHILTILLLSFAPAMDTMVRGLVRHLVPPMTGEGVLAERAYTSTKRSYVRIGRVLVFVVVMFSVGRIWGIEFANLAEAGVGAQFAGRFIEILVVIAIGYLVWELVSLWINRKLAAEQTAAGFDLNEDEPGGGEGGGAGGSRLSTVLPLLLGVMKAAIAVIFGLIALGNVGIDITPLLAGAGIVGLAVGFGAQKLVADVVSGIFFLVDDAFRTGEYVEVEGTVGTVEKISIRSMQLRHHKGPVHTIPYGEIPKITNYSRDWVIMKLKFTVPFDTDPNKVKKLFKAIGKEMMEVPEFAQDLLQPFKSQGVFDFDDVGMIIRGKFMAKPGKQFTLRKEIYNRVKKTFEANGIDFARREVRVAIPGLDGPEKLTEDDKAAIAAAATQAAQEQAAEGEAEKPK
ncbi:MAG: mechanosensitive ion channel domain-containing protein [Pseudomonadota bacterium]